MTTLQRQVGVIALLLAAQCAACGRGGGQHLESSDAANDAEADLGAEVGADGPANDAANADGDTEPEDGCHSIEVTWSLAGEVVGAAEAGEIELDIWEERDHRCTNLPDVVGMEIPGDHVGTYVLNGLGAFEVELAMDYVIEPPDLFLRVSVDVDGDGDCDGGTELHVGPDNLQGVVLDVELGECPGVPL
jgi:hypothetical protein